jgi:hypothetical protein
MILIVEDNEGDCPCDLRTEKDFLHNFNPGLSISHLLATPPVLCDQNSPSHQLVNADN